MKFRSFGAAQSGISVIGQGTWNLELAPRADAIKTLQRGIDLGMTHIDTAEMYGSGRAEALTGEAIAGRRDKVFLVSKVLPSNASRKGTLAACERSLKQLKTDYLDCYLLHWRGSYALEDTFAAFDELKSAGKIRSWGVSNFDEDDLQEALGIAGKGKIACNQVLYHLRERAIEHAVIPWCEKNGVAVVAYSPFGQMASPALSTPGGKTLAEIADARDATPRQVALAFLTRNKSVLAIPKASKVAHAEENAGAGDLELTAKEIEKIDQAFPPGRPKSLPML
jgi:diketogulonate reductase-like aldo/keto reductase